jgi:hypothetical protein
LLSITIKTIAAEKQKKTTYKKAGNLSTVDGDLDLKLPLALALQYVNVVLT